MSAQGSEAAIATSVDPAIPAAMEHGEAHVDSPRNREAKILEFLKHAKEAKRKILALSMKKEIAEMAKVTGLNVKGAAELETASRTAIEKCLSGWSAQFSDQFRSHFLSEPSKDIPTWIDDMALSGDCGVAGEFEVDDREPADEPEWYEAVKRTLTQDQSAIWMKLLADRKAAHAKDIQEYLTPMAGGIREQFHQSVHPSSAKIQRILALPPERMPALDALGASVVQKSMERWQKRAEKALASMSAQERKMIKDGQITIAALPREMPEQRAAWREGLAKILTHGEAQRLEAEKREHHARRLRAFAQMTLVELDQKVAFTAGQRERLRPIAERLVNVPAFFPATREAGDDPGFQTEAFLTAAAAASEQEITAILDSAQWKRWKDTCEARAVRAEAEANPARPASPKVVAHIVAEPEPEDFEMAISDFFYQRSAPVRKRMLAAMTLRAEEAVRLAGLAPESGRRLQIAARGATEESLTAWKTNANEVIRQRLSALTVLGTHSLSNIRDNALEQIREAPPEKQPVWEKAVQTELNAEQKAKWQKEIDERNSFKFKSIASLVLSEFNERVFVSLEQWDKLEPRITATAIECAQEIPKMWVSGASNWYLTSETMFIPVAGIPDRELADILTKEQVNQWKRTDECASAVDCWGTIQQLRAERGKERK